ncbi:MAG: rod shape-determining protein MreC [Oscillospiraceae bacterium]|jgi:rod shape-determining protein MreC|nr:rod shape-determining protein MreC [Oscillospiraceae bacterium]
MKAFVTKRNIAILVLALLIAAVAVVSRSTRGDPGFITNGANALTNPLKRAAASLAHTFETIYGYMYKYEQLMEENEALKEQISALRQEYREITEVTEENKRLHELLNLSARHQDFVLDAATIMDWSASSYSSSFVINKGANNSAAKTGDAVITETGVLIGRVTEVRAAESVCVSIIDTTFSAAVHIGERGAEGIASGDFELMRDGALRLANISDDTIVLAGDAVVTSGRGRKYPDGLVIGTVVSVRRDEAGIGMYAVIQPEAQIRDATYCYLVTEFTEQ